MEHRIAQLLLEEKAVTLNPGNPYTYASGIRSPIYCDNRVLISNPHAREKIIDAFLRLIAQHNLEFDVVAGTATAGIPWAAWIAQRLAKPLVYIRGKAKDHGKQNAIEGRLPDHATAIVIEDLISTGGSSHAAVEELRNAGVTVVACLAIFTYEMRSAKDTFNDCPLHTTTRFSVLIDEARKNGHLSDAEAAQVLEWNEDPQGWATRMGL